MSLSTRAKTVLVIAGGPSVNALDLDLATKFRTIAVNNAWRVAPWAEECYAGDKRWWRWNGAEILRNFDGEIATGWDIKEAPDHRVQRYRVTMTEQEIWLASHTYGPDSGTKALCRAYHRGGRRILLAGYDLAAGPRGETHFHNEHKEKTNPTDWLKWGAAQKRLAELLVERGVELYRVTEPGLDSIPFRPLEEFYEGKPSIRAASTQPDGEFTGDTRLCGSGVRQL